MSSGEEKPSAVQERLAWQVATRDDARVAQGLYAGEEIEEMHESLVRRACSTSFLPFSKKAG
jgi:hypothetical protein